MVQNRPIALTLLAAVLLYAGLDAIMGIVGSFSAGRVNVNLAVLLLPAGIGLLCLSEGWRKFTLFCIGLATLILLALVIYEGFSPGKMPVTWFGRPTQGFSRYILFVFIFCVVAAFLFWAFHTLTRPEIRILFLRKEPHQPAAPAAPGGRGAS